MTRLVLRRMQGETIVTDGPVRITIERINRSRVKLLCEADPDTLILRGELERKEPTDDKHACRIDEL